MDIKQISIFLENRGGRLAEVTDVLGRADINIRALSLADTSDFGILRLIVDRPDDAVKALKEKGFTVRETNVVAVEVPDKPGGLAGVLKKLRDFGISIEYMYAFVEKATDKAVLVFRFDEVQKALKTLEDTGVTVLKAEQVYSI